MHSWPPGAWHISRLRLTPAKPRHAGPGGCGSDSSSSAPLGHCLQRRWQALLIMPLRVRLRVPPPRHLLPTAPLRQRALVRTPTPKPVELAPLALSRPACAALPHGYAGEYLLGRQRRRMINVAGRGDCGTHPLAEGSPHLHIALPVINPDPHSSSGAYLGGGLRRNAVDFDMAAATRIGCCRAGFG